MVHIERTPLRRIVRAEVYANEDKLPLHTIVERRQPDLAMTAAFFSPAKWAPVCPVKAEGEVLWASPTDSYWALAWDAGPDVIPELVPPGGAARQRSYVANCLLVRSGKPQPKLYYNADVGGRRGRVAVGLTETEWISYGATDGSSGAQTPEECRDYMAKQGCRFAVMMDGGGKVNYYCREAGVMMEGKDPSQTLILLYLDDEEGDDVAKKTLKVCLDPGHDAGNTANKSPDGTYYEHEFCLDMGKRIRSLLTAHGVAVTMTRSTGTAVTLANRCKIANAITDLDLFVSLHSNAAGRSGWSTAKGWSAYVYKTSGNGYEAAKDILEAVKSAGIVVRSTSIVADPSLYVLNGTIAPAVLIEHGFHTNQSDVEKLKDSSYREKLAEAEAKGILNYLGIAWKEPEKEEAATMSETDLAVQWIQDVGIMAGNSSGDMMLDDKPTRRQIAIMLYRFAKWLGKI